MIVNNHLVSASVAIDIFGSSNQLSPDLSRRVLQACIKNCPDAVIDLTNLNLDIMAELEICLGRNGIDNEKIKQFLLSDSIKSLQI